MVYLVKKGSSPEVAVVLFILTFIKGMDSVSSVTQRIVYWRNGNHPQVMVKSQINKVNGGCL